MSDRDFQYAFLLQKQFERELNSPSTSSRDREVAMQLQQQFEQEVATEDPKTLVYDTKTRTSTKDPTKSLIDPSWEIVDPTPDIHVLFVAFNERFFWNKLLSVCVSWSRRMTSCAGICTYQGRGGMCSITLSEPLLKLRPRKDLVETLLHEMIHAFLFVTHNNRDRDGHGPEFHKHMFRINKDAGTKITVYHSFHDEVRLYQQHWWRCNGPCQHRKPFFGMVRRAMNRAPGPKDLWWGEHARNCGGEFIKVRGPEKKKKASNKENNDKKVPSSQKTGIAKYFPVLHDKNRPETSSSANVHGFDSAGNVTRINTKNPNTTTVQPTTSTKRNSSSTIVVTKNKTSTATTSTKNINTKISSTAQTQNTLGGATSTKNDDYSAVRNHWLNKFSDKKRPSAEKIDLESKKPKLESVSCPVCHKKFSIDLVDEHLDVCLKKQTEDENGECVICGEFYPKSSLEQHVSECFKQSFGEELLQKTSDVEEQNTKEHEVFVIEDDEEEDESVRHGFENSYVNEDDEKKYNCPFCFKMFLENEMCAHLSECVTNKVDDEEELDKSVLLEELCNVDF